MIECEDMGRIMSGVAELLQRVKLVIGSETLKQWHRCRLRYTVTSGGMAGHIVEWQDCRAGRYRIEHNFGLDTGAACFDGLAVWSQDAAGFVRPEGGDDARLDAMNTAYRVCHALWFPERWSAELIQLPVRQEDGRWYECLWVIPRGGRPYEVWLDLETLLISRLVEYTAFETRTSTLSDYRALDGVMLPHTVTISNGDLRFDQQRILTDIDINPPFDATIFALRSPTAVDYHWPSKTLTITIPFRLVSNLIIVEASLNGHAPLSFIVDTGACHIVTPETAQILGLEQKGHTWGFGAGADTIDVGLTQVESLEIGSIIFTRQLFRVYPFPGLCEVLGLSTFGGLLGYELFMRFVIQVDYQRKQLILALPDHYRYVGDGQVIPFEFNYNIPEVKGSVDGLIGKFNLDTGNTGALILYTPFVEQHRLVERYLPREPLTAEGSAGGAVTILPVQVDELYLGTLRVIDLPAGLSLQRRGALCNPYAAGLVGSELFCHYTMIFDYAHQRVIFEEACQESAMISSLHESIIRRNRDIASLLLSISSATPAWSS